jgi:hypothetical protein
MAYNRKYKITMATKSGSTSYLYLSENDYVGDLIEYPAETITIQYIPQSDDVFEAIYVAQLAVAIDVTDNLEQMPDFTELDDRKYFVELLNNDTDLDFEGWTISDVVQFGFSTGRRTLEFNAIDGLGLLGKIQFDNPTDETVLTRKKALFYVDSALSKIGFPTDLNIISGISFYGSGMINRDDDPEAEPLNQSYYQNLSFIGKTYLEVLTMIISGFGSRLFQAKGVWYIVPLTQIAADSYYYTLYQNGIAIDSGSISDLGNIEGFSGNTSNLYFAGNSQFKLLRKGYNTIISKNDAEYADNYISNGTFKAKAGNDANFWTNSSSYGAVTLKQNPNSDFNAMVLSLQKVTSAAGYARIKTTYLTGLNIGDIGTLSFNCVLKSFSITPPNVVVVKIIIDGGGFGTWYLNTEKRWSNFGTDYYFEKYENGTTVYDVSIDMPPTSFSGAMSIEIAVENSTSTLIEQVVEVQNVVLTQESSLKSVTTTSTINSNNDYTYEAKILSGFNSLYPTYNFFKGYLSDVDGTALNNWYSLNYPDLLYTSLSELVVKQYANVLSKNIINIDCTITSMDTANGRFSGAMRITADDTDPVQISVQDKKYIVGNTTMDLFNDDIQSSLLEITDLDNPNAVVTTKYDSSVINPETEAFIRYRSEGYDTYTEAAAATVGTDFVYSDSDDQNPPVGYIFYTNDTLADPFNGSFLWYKLDLDPAIHVYKISSEGQILEIYS